MKTKCIRELLLASTIVSGLMFAAPAFAQTAPAADEEEQVVVVTGTRIQNPNMTATSPITAVTGADITEAGVTRVEDLINQLPQAIAAQNSTVSNGSTGTATVNLRGIGASRTLVLVDGRRMPYGSPNSVPADLNSIPGHLVQRVEVLTGGASAVYGSDAVAGVVNFIMRKDIEGVEINVQTGLYQHNNDYDGVGDVRAVIAGRAATNPREFALPKDSVYDGRGSEITIALGLQAPDERGSAVLYAGYRQNDPVLQADRDFSACSFGVPGATATRFACGGSGTAAGGQFTDFATFALTTNTATAFRNYSGATDAFNFGPLNYFQRPDERYSLGAFADYQLNDKVEVYTQLMFTDSATVAQIAPSGAFFLPVSVPCDNPLLSDTMRGQIGCTTANVAAGDSIDLFVGKRNVEGGNRQDDLRYQTFRTVLGGRGDIVDGWTYDLSASYARVQMSRVYRNELSQVRTARALDVVRNPANGQAACRSALNGVDPSCVPYNVWVPGGVTAEALAYVGANGIQTGSTEQQVVNAVITGDLGMAGIKSPFAESGVMVAFGTEYRRDELVSETDYGFTTGDLAGQGGPTIGLSGSSAVTEFFGELQVPVVEDKPFAKVISFEGAYRFSKYSSGQETTTFKVGGDWSPIDALRLRASFQRASRAANVIELFEAQGLGLFDMDDDPCARAAAVTAGALRDRCLATGVPVANLGNAQALISPAGQYNFFGGGNPNLVPEEADTYTVGLVFTPGFLPGFNATIDFYSIDVAGLIDTFGALNTVGACYDRGDAAACSRIQRNAIGNLWTAGGQVLDLNINIGGLKTEGVDLAANYRFDLDSLGLKEVGSVSIGYIATILQTYEKDPGGGTAPFSCVGVHAGQCLEVRPEYRHRARVGWDTPWDISVSATWRYISDVKLQTGAATRIDYAFDAEHYFDLAGTWDVRDNVSVRFGVNNVLDNDPPLSGSVGTTGNGNTYPQTYDAMGRFLFMGATLKF